MFLERKTSLTRNPHAKILNLWFSEHTLGRVYTEAMEAETVKNLADMVEVGFCIRTGYEQVININKTMRNIT
jgi:hypothetical protein